MGSAVVRTFAEQGVKTTFTYLNQKQRSTALAAEVGHACHQVDLKTPGALADLLSQLQQSDDVPTALVHCAALPLSDDAEEHDWSSSQAVQCQSALWATRALAPHWHKSGGANVILLGALSPPQSLPLPTAFAATQGMLPALAMAMGREFGPQNIRTNLVTLGLMGQGLSANLSAKLKENFLRFSALRRMGDPSEVARAIVWLAINNTYVNGKVIPINGGV